MKSDVTSRIRGFMDSSDAGCAARAYRVLTAPISAAYSCVVRARNFAYDVGLLKSGRAGVPVVSVGNITMGGVGKSPFVAWLAARLIREGFAPGLISRGYRAEVHAALFRDRADALPPSAPSGLEGNDLQEYLRFSRRNDEARELEIRFPTVPHFLCPDRVEAANAILRFHPNIDVILLDDAFQHRRIRRDFDVVLLDALNPFGGNCVAPGGYLREPVSSLSRADAALLSRADLVDDAVRTAVRNRVRKLAPDAVFCEIRQRPDAVCIFEPRQTGRAETVRRDYAQWRDSHKAQRAVAFCGLGAPRGFRNMLDSEGFRVAEFEAFPDHHVYSEADAARLGNIARAANADFFLTTMKDFVKLNASLPFDLPVCAIQISAEFVSGESEFLGALLAKISPEQTA